QQGIEDRRHRGSFRTTAFSGFSAESAQQCEQLRHIAIAPSLPLFCSRSSQIPREHLYHLIHLWCNHLSLDLLPVFQPLDLRPHARQLNGPSEEVGRRHPLTTMLKCRGYRRAILFFKRSDHLTLSIE